MKITTERLKQIIAEEVTQIMGLEQPRRKRKPAKDAEISAAAKSISVQSRDWSPEQKDEFLRLIQQSLQDLDIK